MNMNYRKFTAAALGIVMGFVFGASTLSAAGIVTPSGAGNPRIQNGTTVSGGRAQGNFGSIQQIGMAIIEIIEVYLIPIVMSLGLLAFLWGVVQFIRKGGDPKEREQGRQFMLWGIIGLAVMASVWGLVRVLTNTIGAPLGIPSTRDIR
jgi:hypothetical protein